MKIHVADNGETLRTISNRYRIELARFQLANTHIINPDANIEGFYVNVPYQELPIYEPAPAICPPGFPSELIDQWIPLTPLAEMERIEYDALIIGSGAGGGSALWRLCNKWNKNKRIGIIEAGNLLLPTHARNLPTLDYERMDKFLLNPKIITYTGKNLPEFPGVKQLFALGGRTLLWGTSVPACLFPKLQDGLSLLKRWSTTILWPTRGKLLESRLFRPIKERIF